MIAWVNARRNRAGHDNETGVAMVMVLGIMLVGAILTSTLAVVTVFGSQQTLKSRVEMQALAGADAGIDMIMDMVEGKTYEELGSVCSQDFVINSDAVHVETEYVVTRGGTNVTVECPTATDIVVSLTLHSEATTENLISTGEPVTRTVVAMLVPTPPEVLLDKAIFSEGSTIITNNSKIIASGAVDGSGNPINDAHIYSNGGVTCKTQVDTGGAIYAAQGDVIIENTCEIGNSVWASGKVSLSSQSAVYGNVYAGSNAATWGIELANNTSLITGSALTNGGIRLNSALLPAGGIGGTAFARTGAIVLQNGASIGGSAYAGQGITLENNSRIFYDAYARGGPINTQNSGNTVVGNARSSSTISPQLIAGTKTPNTSVTFPSVPNPSVVFPASVGYPTNIQAPPREQMPQVTMSAADVALWEASGWAVERHTNKCSGNNPANVVNGGSWSSPRLIIFEGCTTPVQFNNHTLTLYNNTALVSNTGFNSDNLHKLSSGNVGERYDMFWIVPADAPGVTWTPVAGGQTSPSCSPARDITINKWKIQEVNWMIYTPCTFSSSNGQDANSEPLTGQIYAGKVNLPNATDIKMKSLPVPSLATSAPDPTSPTDMRISSRFDEHG